VPEASSVSKDGMPEASSGEKDGVETSAVLYFISSVLFIVLLSCKYSLPWFENQSDCMGKLVQDL
jgi:hypothetical protein